MKLEIHQETDSHTFPTHLAGANGRTNEIAYCDEFAPLSCSADLSAVDADALLTTQLTVLGFPLVNYQQYLNFSLRLDSTFFSGLFMMLVCKHWKFCPLLHTEFFPLNRVLVYANC